MPKLAHIINPVVVKESSDLFVAQPITFQTMKVAQEFSHEHDIEVQLYSAQYPEDRSIVPESFLKTPDLERSVLDIGDFQVKRKLPLIKDILDRLYEATDADYLIYTNVDIALMPNFYFIVSQIINQGCDAFVINRRTISNQYTKLEEIPLMYAEAGDKHRGHDCFVFKASTYKNFDLGLICIGASLVGRALLVNLVCNANKFEEFKDLHLTFHLGNDSIWRKDKFEDYSIHNLKELNHIIKIYEISGRLKEHPLIEKIVNNNNIEYWVGTNSKMHNSSKVRFTQLFKKKIKSLFFP